MTSAAPRGFFVSGARTRKFYSTACLWGLWRRSSLRASLPKWTRSVADSPFLNIEHTVMHHLDLLFGLPRFPFGSSLLLAIELSAGFDRDDFDLEKAVARMGERPVLIVAGEEDRRMSVALQERVFKASVSDASRFRSFPDARHGAAYRMHADAYEAMLMDFVEDAIRSPELPEASDVDSNPGSP